MHRARASRPVCRYLLHWYVYISVVFASVNYSCRFNDEDGFHKVLWAAFTLGLMGQACYRDVCYASPSHSIA